MSFLKRHWGTIMAVAGPLVTFLQPSLRAYAASHPGTLAAVCIGVGTLLFNSTAAKDKTPTGAQKVFARYGGPQVIPPAILPK